MNASPPPRKFAFNSRVLAAALALCLAAAALAWFWRGRAPLRGFDPVSGSGSIANPFKDAPAFRLRNDQGKAVALEDFRGKVIVLHFWATWCPPCIDELPQWVEFARKFENQPVAWVAVSLDRSWDDAHRYLKPEKLPANVVSLLDPENQIPEKFGSYQFPETYLIGPDLKILSKWVGAQDWESPTKEEVIQRVVDLTQARK